LNLVDWTPSQESERVKAIYSLSLTAVP